MIKNLSFTSNFFFWFWIFYCHLALFYIVDGSYLASFFKSTLQGFSFKLVCSYVTVFSWYTCMILELKLLLTQQRR